MHLRHLTAILAALTFAGCAGQATEPAPVASMPTLPAPPIPSQAAIDAEVAAAMSATATRFGARRDRQRRCDHGARLRRSQRSGRSPHNQHHHVRRVAHQRRFATPSCNWSKKANSNSTHPSMTISIAFANLWSRSGFPINTGPARTRRRSPLEENHPAHVPESLHRLQPISGLSNPIGNSISTSIPARVTVIPAKASSFCNSSSNTAVSRRPGSRRRRSHPGHLQAPRYARTSLDWRPDFAGHLADGWNDQGKPRSTTSAVTCAPPDRWTQPYPTSRNSLPPRAWRRAVRTRPSRTHAPATGHQQRQRIPRAPARRAPGTTLCRTRRRSRRYTRSVAHKAPGSRKAGTTTPPATSGSALRRDEAALSFCQTTCAPKRRIRGLRIRSRRDRRTLVLGI